MVIVDQMNESLRVTNKLSNKSPSQAMGPKTINKWSLIKIFCLSASLAAASAAHSGGNVGRAQVGRQFNLSKCDDSQEFKPIKERILALEPGVKKIVDYVTSGEGKGSTYEELALFCDTFGPRLSGSKNLELAIDYLKQKLLKSGLEVSEEAAMIPKWEVLSQSCEITEPKAHKMSILALGNSSSTNGPLEAGVFLVHNFQELEQHGSRGDLKNKIVVYNYKFTTYPESVKYRTTGSIRASKYGALATLVRSVTDFSINSPHAGGGGPKAIPTAAITVEDANLIERWIKRNKTVRIRLDIRTKHHPDVQSRNLIGDIRGTTNPKDVVFVSGHTDSWYNTAGAMDDGGGMMISYKALDVLNKLGLRGARTMRAILWTAEEPGLIGAQQYFENHKHELDSFKTVIESDLGTFKPLGLSYRNMGNMGQCVMKQALQLASERLSEMQLNDNYEGSDIELFTDAGVPGLSLLNENSRYFYFHHTSGDTIDLEDPDSLDRGTGLFAATLYVLANLDIDMRT